MNSSHPLFGIEKVRPVKIIQYWPYEKAYVRRPTGKEYTFDFMFDEGDKAACNTLRELLMELYKKKAEDGLYKGEPKGNFPGVSRYQITRNGVSIDEIYFTPDNKEVYLYETEDGREIAVGYKDCRVIFGHREDIQDYHSGKSLF